MTDKEIQIRANILPQLDSFVDHLWEKDVVSNMEKRKLEQIVRELNTILDDSDD